MLKRLNISTNIIIFCLIILVFQGCDRITNTENPADNIPPAVPQHAYIYFSADAEIILRWSSNREFDIKGYNVYRSIDSIHFNKVTFTSNNYYYDDSLNYTQKYYYYITAVDDQNLESAGSDTLSAVPANLNAPYVPLNLLINARNWINIKAVALKWDPPYESDIKGYHIFRSLDANFIPDISNEIGFTSSYDYTDTLLLLTGIKYYYKIQAEDNGGLRSKFSSEVWDRIDEIPLKIKPADNEILINDINFKIKALSYPATYKIIIQSNELYGELYNDSFSSKIVNDTITIMLNNATLNYNQKYYWRILTFSENGFDADAISPLSSFIVKAE